MSFPEYNQPIDIRNDLVNLKTYRQPERAGGKPDPVVIYAAYAQDRDVYQDGRIVTVDAQTHAAVSQSQPNELVNKFGLTYTPESPLLLHKRLADVMIDVAIDMRDRYGQFTVIMDALRTYDSGRHMEKQRPDLVEAKLLAPAGSSAHNRALAVDSKLFEPVDKTAIGPEISLFSLAEADEKGHLDDLDMTTNNRFYNGPMTETARRNRLNRLQAWQRASVKNKLPVANLIAEFWDDRVPGSPADIWRVLTCRALCLGMDGNPKTNSYIHTLKTNLEALHEQQAQDEITRQQFAESAYAMFATAWNDFFFSDARKQQLEKLLGPGGGQPPALSDFLFHEWLDTIHDRDLVQAGLPAQSVVPVSPIADMLVDVLAKQF